MYTMYIGEKGQGSIYILTTPITFTFLYVYYARNTPPKLPRRTRVVKALRRASTSGFSLVSNGSCRHFVRVRMTGWEGE